MSSDFDNRLYLQISQLQAYLRGVSEDTFAAANYAPELGSWDGSPTDLEGLSTAFSRDDIKSEIAKALDKDSPGTIGDIQINMVQGDILACMERAYRLRLSSAARRRAHADALARGHSHAAGIWERGIQTTIAALRKRATKK